jgi:hypothetical protein
MQSIILTAIRQSITVWGGTLVSSGVVNADQLDQLSGAVLIIASFAWSIISQKLAKRKAAK